MANNQDTFSAEIILNTQNARNKIKELEKDLAHEKQVLQVLTKDEQKHSQEIFETQQRISKLNKELGAQKAIVSGLSKSLTDLSKSSYKDLQKESRALIKELQSGRIEKGSEEWERYAQRVRECKKEMQEFTEAMKPQASAFSRFIDSLNKNWGAATQIYLSFKKAFDISSEYVDAYAAMQQEMADVRKYTGQAAEEVERMNEDFKKMDTRTAREELNQLAGAAGRLGITATDKIEEFVDAADKIGVALGDDLGKGAVDTIGKLAIAFGEDRRLGLRGAMLATGSALNEIAGNSSAAAGNVVEFTKAISGVGQQANITVANLMGFGSVLDQNNQEMATSATVMSQLITKIYQDPARFAKMAGMEVKGFADLVKRDMNAALVDWLKHVNALGDMSVLASSFDELKMDGTRAIGVISTLAGHVDQLVEAQKVATDGYREATSVVEEFNTQNTTVQAGLDKAKKRLHDLAIELGEKLEPAAKFAIGSASTLVKMLGVLVTWFAEYKTYIVSATLALIAYSVVAKSDAMWNKLVAGIKIAITGFKNLKKVMMENPWGLIAVGVSLVVAKLIEMKNASDQAKESAREMLDLEIKASAQYHESAAAIKALDAVIRSETASNESKKEALDKLREIIPEYNGMLDDEGRLIRDNKEAIDQYLISLEKQIRLKAYQGKLEELYKKQADLEDEQKDKSKKYWDVRSTNTLQGYNRNSFVARISRAFGVEEEDSLKKDLESTENNLADVNGKIDEMITKIATVSESTGSVAKSLTGTDGTSTANKGNNATGSGTRGNSNSTNNAVKTAADNAKADYQAQLAQEMLSYRKGEIAYSQYLENKHRITQDYYDRMKGIYGEDSNEYKKMLDDREREESGYYQHQNKKGEDKIALARMKREHDLQMQFLNDKNSTAYQNEEVLNEALFQSDMEYMRAMRDLHHAGSKEWEEWETRLKGEELKHKYELEENYQKQLQQYRRDFGLMSAKELEEIELKSVETLYQALRAQGKMTEEEYKRIVSEIKKSYAELDASQTADKSIRSRGSKALETASKKAGPFDQSAGGDLASSVFNISSALAYQKTVNDKLKELYEEDAITQEEFEEAKRQNAMQTSQVIMASASAALQEINNMLGSVSAYMQACSNLEVAQIQKNYDAQIEAAGKNSKKREKLEKKRDEEIAKAKTKASKKAMAMEMAQAVASTAMAAINAYSSAAQTPVIGWTLAPIAAGLALAAGAIQIATIKKQHQAEQAGYYEGGYTGGRRYKKQAGVVHEGEFVANHKAVNNPQLAPFFSLIDQAQRNNRVASLTASDVTNAIGSPAVRTPIVNVVSDNSDLNDSLGEVRNVMQSLSDRLQDPIDAVVSFDEFKKKWDHNNRLLKNK